MSSTRAPTPARVLRGYLLLPHAVPVIVVIAATAAFALIASGGWPGAGPMARLLGAMLGGQVAIGAINELVDVELDRAGKPHKPIAAGIVTERGARTVTVVGLGAMAALSATFGVASLLLCALGTGCGIAYSLWFKRTIWAWVPYLIALPLLPIWVWTALDSVDPALLGVYPLGAGAVIAVQLAQSLPDIAGDRAAGVRTLAVALGARRARLACWGAMALTAAGAALLALWLTDRPGIVLAASAVALALVAFDAVLWRRDPHLGVQAAFPCVASATVLLGLAWVAAIIGS
jgi:4-hydroxybenzoate polyprenyltransferase